MVAQLSPDGYISSSGPCFLLFCYFNWAFHTADSTSDILQSHALFWTLVSIWLCDQKCASPLHNEIFQDNNNNNGAPDGEWGMEAGVNLEQAES